jgi:hypothetical protein
LNGIQPPPSVYTTHVFLDRENLEQYYPAAADSRARAFAPDGAVAAR